MSDLSSFKSDIPTSDPFFQGKVKACLRRNWSHPAQMIKDLNSRIRGWCNYHKTVVSKKTFNNIDQYIYHKLWKWGKRTHRNKGKRWIANKYFQKHGTRKWVFTARDPKKGKTERLIFANNIKIVRHPAIKGNANPFDELWTPYFEMRKQKSIRHKYPRIYERLWKQQNKVCSLCQKGIDSYISGRIHYPQDNIATDSVPIYLAKFVHKQCHEALRKTGSTTR